jgi:hypothetical protein
MLTWEICSLETPYEGMSDDMIERKVVHCGYRPKICAKWPAPLRRLMQDCFASAPRRPQMEVACDVLGKEINKLSPDEKLVDEDVLESARSAMSARHF